MYTKNYRHFILFWLSQSVSQLGSSMTGFALVIWTYKQTGSAMAVSLLTFFAYLPYVIISIFAGAFVDTHNKNKIILYSDSIAAICSLSVIALVFCGNLQLWYIYIVNTITGFMNSFQSPASMVAIGLLVPKDKYAKVSGLNSFSTSLITVVTPMLAAFIMSFWGLGGVLFVDMGTFLFAFSVLLFLIDIPENTAENKTADQSNLLSKCKEGLVFLKERIVLLYVILSMALLNFFSFLTYDNILPAMILARSGGNDSVLGIVSGVLGFGGIIGGLIVSLIKSPKSCRKMIYLSAALSFLLGDLMMGIGQNIYVWIFAAMFASTPIPFIMAGQNVIMYTYVPKEMQGRVFAVRNALQYFTIPIGILLGGFLADYVFESFMQSGVSLSAFLHQLVGTGNGSGMAVMFICTGTLGFISSIFFYKNKRIRSLDEKSEPNKSSC